MTASHEELQTELELLNRRVDDMVNEQQEIRDDHDRILDALMGPKEIQLDGSEVRNGGVIDDVGRLISKMDNGGVPAHVRLTTAQKWIGTILGIVLIGVDIASRV